jgi:uncharacterized Zn-binding protein involved in type VI secretion
MAGVQRQGDANSAGGVITGGNSTVRVNGRPIAVDGLSVTPHPCCGRKGCPPIHCNATTKGSSSVKAGGLSVIVSGDVDTCGHARSGGSSDVKIG